MASLQRRLSGSFFEIRSKIYHEIVSGSISCELNGSHDFTGKNSRCSVMVFERYSAFGGNRVSLSVTLYQEGDGPVQLSAISSGGSQAIFAKVNTFSEEAFLNKLREIVDN
ncbi:MAG: hypothetical protein IJ424_06030 [Oscillospiraceae bacterium]|nr:hypothetical protein [Oscillospiraceae bacterium]